MNRIFTLVILFIIPFSYGLCQRQYTAEGELMQFFVRDGDTIFISHLPPAYKQKKGLKGQEKKKWRKYYRLVHNFSKAYPYALLAKEKVNEANSYMKLRNFNKIQKERYLKSFEKELFKTFEKPLKHLTITQGKILLRLIDREIGENSYVLIKGFKGGIAAGFWQGIAIIFGSSLKNDYDKYGRDRDLEELVIIYQKGEFNSLYYSIFGKMPPDPIVKPLLKYPQSLDF